MFALHTERLSLVALDVENLKLSLDDPGELQRNLGLRTRPRAPEGELRDAVEHMLEGVLDDQDRYLWYTHWQIVLRRDNGIIGGLCFKGPPKMAGDVEIGYGVDSDFRNRGYMTEALGAACRWALQQPAVVAVIAETEKSNLASQRVLEKAGFVRHRETEEAVWWRLDQGNHWGSI